MPEIDNDELCKWCVMDESICCGEMCSEAVKKYILAHPGDFEISPECAEEIKTSIFGV